MPPRRRSSSSVSISCSGSRAGALWRDEVNTLQLAAWPSVREICDALQYDSFPVLSSLALPRLGSQPAGDETDFGLRAFGFTVGIAILAALWLDARLKGISVPLLSMPLFALSPAGDSIRRFDPALRSGNCLPVGRLRIDLEESA